MFKTIREEVVLVIRDKILKGEIKQGERIKEADLSKELGVSRGPIREAFRQLEQEGLISYSSRKGCTVKIISAKDSVELYILRATLENLSVKLCNGKFKETTINKMDAIVKEMEKYTKVEDLVNIIECDQQFHELIIHESQMKKLYEMWSTLNSANAIIFYALYHTRYSPSDKLSGNHNILVNAIKESNCEEICKCIQEHYLIVSENLYKTENVEINFDIKL
ncbi:GntR family transcriptional regulator [Clostridium sp. 'deep sea']|uniref:GntR family transcriptional regulator n=1 Tax=Clostridium sp. 'deep sea' TaxID=2779445 RepID=UPI0018967690|nr:GntR family transcriptional regulator [Clostridium sp. 'deep sea']QOR36095.1 GntR family transcriptional regulator [Clostridium sp. 'deep sea']